MNGRPCGRANCKRACVQDVHRRLLKPPIGYTETALEHPWQRRTSTSTKLERPLQAERYGTTLSGVLLQDKYYVASSWRFAAYLFRMARLNRSRRPHLVDEMIARPAHGRGSGQPSLQACNHARHWHESSVEPDIFSDSVREATLPSLFRWPDQSHHE